MEPGEKPNGKHDAADVTGVSETALLTLLVRATEARRPDALLKDPMAIHLVDSIDFDFGKFGYVRRQDMSLRSLAFDKQTARYLHDHPKATVVALAEGLQTSFYRLEAQPGIGHDFRWLTVDLPPMIELRRKLLPASDRVRMLAQSALDFSWMDQVDSSEGVFITAEGLLMYLQPEESMALITECAARFPGGRMLFDLPPAGFAPLVRRGMRASRRYKVPPMPFTMSVAQAADLVNTVPGVRAVHDVPAEHARGRVLNALLWTAQRVPLLDPFRPMFTLLEFG
ncbi:class I SAM-dependent methyltransferase [Mycolicibacterium vaccae]|jgi:O-methyltransferase involved in polyketide biosynthesis|uniref:O-methyltransferase domain-containing protein n=1 Tax=Mycolicibacterium vaccae ATCC 25954 TaxID=1194972 RepID=K0V1K8_MYCVA|nr:class I SAM-dependent methyltransferase [Mycolicibacterium vaccae]ANI41437.1 O-methyltransferase [Mycolicibacterium vaccae 95051]EJZ04864.1 O-methyltransferase domain-containing protein [Mycolicibacterium vaccae ATCC 25954]MCV7064072.1 class I SAM-dependent methyltransferase [Mycolicibacterium vaccae]